MTGSSFKDFEDELAQALGAQQNQNTPSADTIANDPQLAAHEEAIRRGGRIPCRTALDSTFRREHSKGNAKQEWEACQGDDAKVRKFKLDWVEKDLSKENQKLVKSTKKTLEKSNKLKGKWFTLGGLVASYGGWDWEPAVEGAKRTAAKCARLGASWAERDECSGSMFYRKLEKSDAEEFVQAWQELKEQFVVKEKRDPVQEVQEVPSTLKRKPEAPGAPNPPPSNNTKYGKTVPPQQDEATPKGESKNVMRESAKFKVTFLKQVQAAEMLIGKIKVDDAYTWARGAELAELEDVLARTQMGCTAFIKDFLVQDTQSVTEAYSPATTIAEMNRFLECKPLVTDLVR